MISSRRSLALSVVAALLIHSGQTRVAGQGYNPLVTRDQREPESLDSTVTDEGRRRDIPFRIYLPAAKTAAPVVLFSHGLGGSREGCAYLGTHWAARGYVAVFLQHPGSDTSVWQLEPAARRMAALEQAANLQNFLARVQDVRAVLDQLERSNAANGHVLAGRLDLSRVGMSGHSFGAVTTQAVSGQAFPRARESYTDPRIKAAIALSPSSPRGGGDPKAAFGSVKIPWMLMTGTKDEGIIGDADVESRLAVFPALPPGGKYELVLYGAEHSAFSDRALPGDKGPRNPNHHRSILGLSTAFWDAWLRNDTSARTWLDGDSARSVLDKNDRWQRK